MMEIWLSIQIPEGDIKREHKPETKRVSGERWALEMEASSEGEALLEREALPEREADSGLKQGQ